MDDFTLGKKLFGKENTTEQKAFSTNPSTASIIEMVAVTSSSGGEVVVRNLDEDSDDIWENGEPGVDYIELDDEGDFEEEAFDNVDDLEEVDDGALDVTDGDGADIEGSDTETVAFTVEAYHAAAVAAAEEEAGQEDDPIPDESASVTDEIDDGDASDVEDPGDPSLDDPLPGEDAEVAEVSDDEYTGVDDNDPDESEEPLEDAEISDGSSIVETTVSVKEGDRVLVSIQDGHMTVIGVVGGGDEQSANLDLAQESADEANAAALEAAEDAAAATEAASNAQAKAEEADAAASAAQTAAGNAQTAANEAKTEAGEALQKANDAQAKADLVETNMAGVNAEIDSVKEDAAKIREEMLTSGDIETVKTEISQSYATKTELSTTETTLKKYTDDSIAETKTTFSQDYAKKTDVEGAIVTAKADLQTQITQNANEISSVAKSVEETQVEVGENATKIQEAQNAATAAQATADAAKTDASEAATAANNAQAAANQAKASADTAQAAADDAAAELETAKAKLAEVEGNANATAEDLAEAQTAVANAQKAADDAAEDAASAKSAADTAQSTADTAKANAAKAQSAADSAQAAANEAKADLSALATRVTAAETSISQNSEQIALRATKTEVTQAVNAIEVGGRNYIRNGRGNVKDGFFANFDSIGDDYGEQAFTSQGTYARVDISSGFVLGGRDYEVGKEIVFSYDIMYTAWDFPEGTDRKELWIGQRYESQKISGGDTTGQWRSITSHSLPRVGQNGCELNEWYRVEYKATIPEQAAEGIVVGSSIQFHNSNADVAASFAFKMRNVKLEYGNKATDWTPAPEDMATVKEMNASIELTASGIRSTVSSVKTTADAAKATADTAKSNIDNLEIGARNLVSGSKTGEGWSGDFVIDPDDGSFSKTMTATTGESMIWSAPFDLEAGTEYTVSWWEKVTANVNSIELYLIGSDYAYTQQLATTSKLGKPIEWTRFEVTFTTLTGDVAPTQVRLRFDHNASSDGAEATVYVQRVQVEKGNKATDWSPAPEDSEAYADASADRVQESVDGVDERLVKAESSITQLANSISSLVKDENGETMMQQDSEGFWFVSLKNTIDNLKQLTTDLEALDGQVGDLNAATADLQKIKNYVQVDLSGANPVLALGNGGPFKVELTNEQLQFIQDGYAPAYINNNALNIRNAVVEDRLKIGGFSWIQRDNGNVGLVWEGEDE